MMDIDNIIKQIVKKPIDEVMYLVCTLIVSVVRAQNGVGCEIDFGLNGKVYKITCEVKK